MPDPQKAAADRAAMEQLRRLASGKVSGQQLLRPQPVQPAAPPPAPEEESLPMRVLRWLSGFGQQAAAQAPPPQPPPPAPGTVRR